MWCPCNSKDVREGGKNRVFSRSFFRSFVCIFVYIYSYFTWFIWKWSASYYTVHISVSYTRNVQRKMHKIMTGIKLYVLLLMICILKWTASLSKHNEGSKPTTCIHLPFFHCIVHQQRAWKIQKLQKFSCVYLFVYWFLLRFMEFYRLKYLLINLFFIFKIDLPILRTDLNSIQSHFILVMHNFHTFEHDKHCSL